MAGWISINNARQIVYKNLESQESRKQSLEFALERSLRLDFVMKESYKNYGSI